jgi:hypothetical protein
MMYKAMATAGSSDAAKRSSQDPTILPMATVWSLREKPLVLQLTQSGNVKGSMALHTVLAIYLNFQLEGAGLFRTRHTIQQCQQWYILEDEQGKSGSGELRRQAHEHLWIGREGCRGVEEGVAAETWLSWGLTSVQPSPPQKGVRLGLQPGSQKIPRKRSTTHPFSATQLTRQPMFTTAHPLYHRSVCSPEGVGTSGAWTIPGSPSTQ